MIKRIRRCFLKDRDGTAAIEFSLLAVPFVLTTICIIELGLYFANAFLLESSVNGASRMIQTGALQQTASTDQEDVFAAALCDIVDVVMNCNALQYEVRQLTDFGANSDAAFNDDGNLDEPAFEPASITAGCVALVRVAYRYQFITPFFGNIFGAEGTTRLLMATTVFRTEPYNFVQNANCTV